MEFRRTNFEFTCFQVHLIVVAFLGYSETVQDLDLDIEAVTSYHGTWMLLFLF